MKNVDVKVQGDKAIVTIDLSKRFGRSASGKNTIVASTGGNVEIGDTGIKVGLNAYVPADADS